MKYLLLILSILKLHSSFSQYYPVPKTKVDLTRFLESGHKKAIEVPEFSISNLVTVKEFKSYLLAVKVDSSNTYYESQLPKLGKKSEELLTAILNDPKFDNVAMPGVSWTVARNYCKWLSLRAKGVGLNYVFEIPKLEEVIAYETVYANKENHLLESWVLNAYDESLFEFSLDAGRGYFYEAEKNDPPAMKRKMIYGGSYHMEIGKNNGLYSRAYEYQDSSSRYIGFRVVCKQPLLSDSTGIIEQFDGRSVSVNSINNHLSGVYTERNQNGRLLVLGEFYEGNRVGIWSLFDSTGNLIVQRDYVEKKKVEFLFPEVENPYSGLYEKYLSTEHMRNDKGYFPYLPVEERAVPYSFRSWRELTSMNEPALFSQVDFKKLVITALKLEKKLFEYGTSGTFATQISMEKYPELLTQLENWDFTRIEIKEDFFYNYDQMRSDTRQLGINFYASKTDTLPKYSLYIPHLRELMSTVPMKVAGNNEIRNLDDYFFFHAYRGEIVYYSSLFDKEDQRRRKLEKDNWYYELIPIITEHRLWLRYNR